MDAEGIYAQVLYPNVGGFGSGGFLKLKEPELMLDCVRAYNDFLVDWCSADPNRLIPVAAMPFWDVGECVKEVHRAVAKGHRAVLAASQPEAWGEPSLASKHWDPFWAAVQETGVPISFHIGGGDLSDLFVDHERPRHARELRARVVDDLHAERPLPRRPDLRRRLPPLPGPRSSCRWRAASAGSRRISRPPTGSS